MSAGPASAAPEFDPARLEAFLRSALPGRAAGAMALERISGGQSNPTFFLSFPEAGTRLVMRKKPPGPLLPSAHAVDREYRILKALAGSQVPVPPVLLFHAEDDIVGTPFYLMERLDGRVFHDAALPGVVPAERRQMYFAMAETLAALHRFDWQAAGLADYGKPGNYYARQLARWGRQWRETRTREIPEIDRLIDWLTAHLDESAETTIVHGDFRLGNLMFHPVEPRVVAVLDWELSTLGHPLSDAAFSCLPWHSTAQMYAGIVGLDREGLAGTETAVAHHDEGGAIPAGHLQQCLGRSPGEHHLLDVSDAVGGQLDHRLVHGLARRPLAVHEFAAADRFVCRRVVAWFKGGDHDYAGLGGRRDLLGPGDGVQR